MLTFSAAIEEQMLSRGYVRSDNPDILINVSVDVEDISRAPTHNSCPSYLDYHNRYISKNFGTGWGNPTFCKYTEGSISIDMVDVNLNHTIWEGDSRVRIHEREKARDFFLKSYIVDDVRIMFDDSPFRAREQIAWISESN